VADAKGYSRLMGEDQVGIVRTLTAHRTVMREAIARHGGRARIWSASRTDG
jgi:adenylate cyclase